MDYIIPGSLYGKPHVKDGCGVFGMITKKASLSIPSGRAVEGICVARQRGSNLGAGFASLTLGGEELDFRLRAFVRDEQVAAEVVDMVRSSVSEVTSWAYSDMGGSAVAGMPVAEMTLSSPDTATVSLSIDSINRELISGSGVKGRIFVYGRYIDVFKGVGFPDDVAALYDLQNDSRSAHVWIAHTRQPTNSPGALPVWSHPFAALDCAIVHNGDISSFGANMAYLESRGYRSHIGTDSEVITRILEVLVREEGLEVEEALTVLSNPHSRTLSPATRNMLVSYRNARLDGPFSVVGSYGTGSDCYMFAVTDRSKFRPLILGEDEGAFYAASEESQIRALSPDAEVWQAEPASFFVSSVKRGLLASGNSRGRGHQVNRPGPRLRGPEELGGYEEINRSISSRLLAGEREVMIEGVNGTRFIGMGISFKGRSGENRIVINGYPGNCLANLNDGGTFEVFGSVADDLADTMTEGKVIIHGNAGDVAGQALQGGHIYVRGSVGNRAAIQMREYEERRPYFIACETAGDYLGEYMAGGRVMVLNLSGSDAPVGNYVGTGMVGGRIYVRGDVKASQVGLLPMNEDVVDYLHSLCDEGLLDSRLVNGSLDVSDPAAIAASLPPEVSSRVIRLFYTTRHSKQLLLEKRKLTDEEVSELLPVLSDCFRSLALPDSMLGEVVQSEYSVVSVGRA